MVEWVNFSPLVYSKYLLALLDMLLQSDLSVRTSSFRKKLVDDFRIADNVSSVAADVPLLSSRDIALDPEAFKKILRDHPLHVIKFKHFKRSRINQAMDKRMTKVRHIDSVPIGVWANWLVNHPLFLNFILLIIILNGLIFLISTDLDRVKYHQHLQIMEWFETFSLLVFVSEIGLKWIDSFKKFWHDGWNIFDFFITIISAIPEVFVLVSPNPYQLREVITILRLFKTLRVLKAIVRFRNLRIIVNTVLQAAKALGSLVLLLSVFIFMYAIIGIYIFENYSNSPIPRRYQYKFQSLPNAFLAVFQIFTFDQWFHVMNDIMNDVPQAIVVLYFLSWIWLGSFIIRNVVIGLIVKTFEDMKKQSVREEKKLKREKSSIFKDFELGVKPGQEEGQNDVEMTFKNSTRPRPRENSSSNFHLKQLYISQSGKPLLSEQLVRNLETLPSRRVDTIWPRDTLFSYLQLMQRITENLQETNELTLQASRVLMTCHDK
ncbi:hypothetical protein P9112_004281 [Eukaryota sp. TZLM1-RC]